MSYRYDKNKQIRKRWYIFGTLFLLIALFTPIYGWLFDVLESPFQKKWNDRDALVTQSSNIFQSFYNRQKLVEENQELKNQIKRLEIDNLRTRYLSDQLEKNIVINELNDITSAYVIRHDIAGAFDLFILDKGGVDGLSVGEYVYSHEHVLIGYLSEVFDRTSELTLFSKLGESREGTLFPHDISLTAEGNGSGTFLINAPRDIPVTAGDIFYDIQEPGHIIAIVRDVVFDSRDPFKQIYLSYPNNVRNIHLVGVKDQIRIEES